MNIKQDIIKYGLSIVVAMGLSTFVSAEDFTQDWRFIRQEASVDADTGSWQKISIPHTWNAIDAQNGGGKDNMSRDGYYRGPGSYAKTFAVPRSYAGKRIFLRFEAVGSVAEVYLNGRRLGMHKGAFGAFTFEITQLVKPGEPNDLRVMANNAWNQDLPPLSGDFPIFGGIYRPVHLIAKEQVCISPLRRGAHGVVIRQENVSEQEATLNITTLISNAKAVSADVGIQVELMNDDGLIVATTSGKVKVDPGTERDSRASLKVSNPRLWDGRRDPCLYTVEVTVTDNGNVVDHYEGRQGFRFFSIDKDKGFLLNGRPYQLWGVNRHQDHEDMGWAITKTQHDMDLALIDEMGTRAIRLAHYPHAEYFYQRCDELGILVTAELPLVNCITDSKAFQENTTLQMNEIIDLYGNYTCVFAYGLYNEMYHRASPPAESLIRTMHDLCKKRDSSRFTYGGTNKGPKRRGLNNATELLAFNGYPGWYGRSSSGIEKEVDSYLQYNKHRGIAVSEYGAGASVKHQETRPKQPKPKGKWHPEGYQALHHEVQFGIMKQIPQVWGTFIWNMFDFSSVWRDEGDRPGINDKGLISHDRRTRKDAFYFYKANWKTAEQAPVLYIAARRHVTRAEKMTPLKVYSNLGPVTLFVNDKEIETKAPNDMRIVQWEKIELQEGGNTIRVISGNHKDSCKWTYRPKHNTTTEQKNSPDKK